jgi:hypothetical protein
MANHVQYAVGEKLDLDALKPVITRHLLVLTA